MSSINEKFCLKWNDFQDNITNSYKELRSNHEFSDVTLVCEDYQHVEAHRVILSACSPFFMNVLKNTKHNHPLIYMKGLKAKNMLALVDFIYHGEANIFQEDLNDFLTLAEELQLKGLSGSSKADEIEENVEHENYVNSMKLGFKTYLKSQTAVYKEKPSYNYPPQLSHEERTVSILNEFNTSDTLVENTEELEVKIKCMLKKIEGKWCCTVCQKNSIHRHHIVQHIEANHIEGISHSCNQCGKVSRSRSALAVHKSFYHKIK